ncbi:MAG: PGF-pre-PGF domain-containing protein, partial [Candidatus Aenigmarchaeota archaeon]|nr:PGF-pre-PGF domain-containing protein [Candidatus Aenigmarchaeota archaeon]
TTFVALDNQQSTLVLWINDTAGNTNSSSVVFTIDTSAPAITITTPANTTTKSDAFAFSFSDVNCSVYSVNAGGNVTNCSIVGNAWSGTLGGLSDGVNNITVWANDSIGNINSTIRYWTRDTDAPDIFNVTNGTVGSTTAAIIWNTTESSNSTVLYSTNQSNLNLTKNGTSFVTEHSVGLTGLTLNTTYYYNISSCDQAGNCNTTGTYNFTTSSASVCVESWSCTEWVLTIGSMQIRTCTDSNSCGTTVNKPVESRRYIGGGGGGTPSTEPPPQVKHSWVKITPGTEVSMTITKEGLDFSEIKITVKNEAKTVTITITKLNEKPADVTHDLTGKKVYQYVTIEKTNLENDNIEKSTIRFKVPKGWISQNGIDKATITLNRYVSGWQALATRLLSEDDDNVYYEADTPGFSVFAISGEKSKSCEPGTVRCSGNLIEQCNEEGSMWVSVQTCERGCDQTSLTCISPGGGCEAGTTRCYGNVLQLCSNDGMEWMDLEVCVHGCMMNERCISGGFIPGLDIDFGDYNVLSGYIIIALVLVLVIFILRPLHARRKRSRFPELNKKRRRLRVPKIRRRKKR